MVANQLVSEFDGPLHPLGIAVGAFVALNALVRHPERIRSVILVNGGPGGVSSATARQNLIERGEAAVRDGMASVVDETFGRWFTPNAQRTNPPGVQIARKSCWKWIRAAGVTSGERTPSASRYRPNGSRRLLSRHR
jgi:pimeloyl-ACP methyl ester carboxylesterase